MNHNSRDVDKQQQQQSLYHCSICKIKALQQAVEDEMNALVSGSKRPTIKSTTYGGDTSQTQSIGITILTFNQGKAWTKYNMNQSEMDIIHLFLQKHVLGSTFFVLGLQEANSILPRVIDTFLQKHSFQRIVKYSRSQFHLGSLQLHIWQTIATDPVTSIIKQGYKICPGVEYQNATLKERFKAGAKDVFNVAQRGFGITMKGALYAIVPYLGRNLVFVSCHLPSSAANEEARNHCLKEIVSELQRSVTDMSLFVFGDLNYRTSNIDRITNKEQMNAIENFTCATTAKERAQQQNTDQLKAAMQRNAEIRALGLHEAPITFCQTCRLKETVTESQRRHFDPKRVPSWCDRILYTNAGTKTGLIIPGHVNVQEYDSIAISTMSDHSAVYAKFNLLI